MKFVDSRAYIKICKGVYSRCGSFVVRSKVKGIREHKTFKLEDDAIKFYKSL